MKSTLHYSLFLFCWIFLFAPNQLDAQIEAEFQGLVDKFLTLDIDGPGEHGGHFKPAAEIAKGSLVSSLDQLIASSISSFPLNSTTAGVTFDFSTGQPVSIRESLGPIFAETAKTLGKGKMNFGMNFTSLNFKKLRGLDTREIRFNFYHENVPMSESYRDYINYSGERFGDSPNESDVMNVKLDLNLAASIFVFYLTAGITEKLDVSVALPLVGLTLSGTPRATFSSFTLASGGNANHNFGQEEDGTPILSLDYEEFGNETNGGLRVGDLALRLKYRILQEGLNVGALLDVRVPIGGEDISLSTGKSNVRLLALFSKKIDDFTPHLNVGYDYRGDELDSNEFEFVIGFDQKITSGLTFAFDVLGEIDLEDDLVSRDGGSRLATQDDITSIFDHKLITNDDGSNQLLLSERLLEDSNIPNINDHILNAAFGLRFAPTDRLQILANILVPLNDGGLRPDFATTFGLSLAL